MLVNELMAAGAITRRLITKRYRIRFLPISFLTLSLAATATLVAQTAAPASGTTSADSLFERQGLPPDANAETRELTDLQLKFEDATIRGDVAFVSSVEDPTMTMVHGDRWTIGGLPQLADDRAAYNQRVASQSYYVHDLDPTSLRYELHRDLAICYGRYLSVVSKLAGSNAPGKITSIWFERCLSQAPRWPLGLPFPPHRPRPHQLPFRHRSHPRRLDVHGGRAGQSPRQPARRLRPSAPKRRRCRRARGHGPHRQQVP